MLGYWGEGQGHQENMEQSDLHRDVRKHQGRVMDPHVNGISSIERTATLEIAIANLANTGGEARGAIYTRREVVDFILDLCGYTSDKPLHEYALLEPSCGEGNFLIPVIERLLTARREFAPDSDPLDLAACLYAVELSNRSLEHARAGAKEVLENEGFNAEQVSALISAWCHQDDYLVTNLPTAFDFVVGNPPYVRQELIPDILLKEYKRRYSTIFDRADLYIPFIERSLGSLKSGGTLGFICADRWMKNRYGGPLRRLVAESYHLRCYVDMCDTDSFSSNVIAYPAITIIDRSASGITRVAKQPKIERAHLSKLATAMQYGTKCDGSVVLEVDNVATGSEPWILDLTPQLNIVRRLEKTFPLIEEAGCKVGIGVATGADKQFIGHFDDLDVEPDRKLPLVKTKDILTGEVRWQGLGIINPFADSGGLVNLADYPRLAAYLEQRKDKIAGRHVAKKYPTRWYRTIDRIYPSVAAEPKLLIPDIKGGASIVLEAGGLLPHHNLYYITSKSWNLHALQAILMSGIAELFITAYSTKMRGGYLRFQAQYIRRIRLPRWQDVPQHLAEALVEATKSSDITLAQTTAAKIYGLTNIELETLRGLEKNKEAA